MPEINGRCPICQVATSDMRRHDWQYHPILATESAPAEITERDRELARESLYDMGDATEDDLVKEISSAIAQARAEGYAAGKAERDAEVHKMAVGVAKLDVEVQRLTARVAELEAAIAPFAQFAKVTAQLEAGGYIGRKDDYCPILHDNDDSLLLADIPQWRHLRALAALAQKGGE